MNILEVETRNQVVEINDPVTHEPMGLKITLRPQSSAEVQRVINKGKREIREAERRNKPTEAVEEQVALDMFVAAIVDWEWDNATLGGTLDLDPLDFTEENVKAVLQSKKLAFIRRDLDKKLGADGDFLQV